MSSDTPPSSPPEDLGRLTELPIRVIDRANTTGFQYFERSAAGLLQHLMEREALFSTKDRARGCLTEYRRRIERRREWIIPFGVAFTFFGCLATIHTGNFTTTLIGLSQDELRGIFYILTPVAVLWTFWALFRLLTSSDISVERVINDMNLPQT